jgi:hypothetical protein
MKTNINRVASAVWVSMLLTCIALPALGDCGKERWPVKTLQDRWAKDVVLKPDTSKTVADLIKFPAPPDLRKIDNSMRLPEEFVTYQVHAVLVGFKKESDEDYHVVLADLNNQALTMVVEVPNPGCANTAYDDKFKAVRAFIESIHTPSAKFYRPKDRIEVTVTGVFFFDFLHGQTGVAPNGAELHPLFSMINESLESKP